ncbi:MULTISPECIES: B12-binding domain-containing radical SAM protein [Bradyrhizobium]|uniref:B12-binding domain-containing radical SAM protein n=1 Tax=Bradyrhizobium pachyrhizi TaxID=280333 RepID=UPI0009B794C1
MQVSLATSLHLDHGARPLDAIPGSRLTMQAFVPVGLLSLKAACNVENANWRVHVHELNTLINAGAIPNDEDFYDNVAQTVVQGGGDLVGLMTDADSLHHTIAIAKRIKVRAPQLIVGLGGPAVTPTARLLLERYQAIDFVVRNEGEETFPEYIAALEEGRTPVGIQGLTWRDGTTIQHNADRKVIEDLDRLPIPDFDAYAQTAHSALYLDVGRGCPFKCAFCATAPFWERRYRMKSIPRILSEMRLLRDRWGRRHFNYSHDIFTCDQKWAHKFCDAMKAAELGVTWTCSTRTDVIDPELLEHMAEAGCVEIYYGIETGSQEMQQTICKGLDLNWSREIVRATAACGIRPVTGFIVGYPEETQKTFSDTIARFFDFLEVGGYRAHIFTLCPFPGAPMFNNAKAGIDRRAAYLDLPLQPAVRDEADQLSQSDRNLFASHYRFATPNMPHEFISAAEEISPHIVLLRRLWPHLLPYYDEPATLFKHWTTWIGKRNDKRPWRANHHGNAGDLIDFISAEMPLLGIDDQPLRNLVRYEAAKLAAAALPADTLPHPERLLSDMIGQGHPFLIVPFETDIGRLVSGRPQAANDIELPQWVVFAREPGGTVNTHVISDAARRVLERARTPSPRNELVRVALNDSTLPQSEALDQAVEIVQALTSSNLLRELRT